jgi:hypothetical protein
VRCLCGEADRVGKKLIDGEPGNTDIIGERGEEEEEGTSSPSGERIELCVFDCKTERDIGEELPLFAEFVGASLKRRGED